MKMTKVFADGVGGEKGRDRIVMVKEKSDNNNEAGNIRGDSVSKGKAEEEEKKEEESIDEDATNLEEVCQISDAYNIKACTNKISQLLSANNKDNVDNMTTSATLLQYFQTLVPQKVF